MEFDKFHTSINTVPYWIKGKKDMFVYARHLAYRMYESREIANFYADELMKLHNENVKDKKKQDQFKEYIQEKVWQIQAEFEKLYDRSSCSPQKNLSDE